MIHYFKFRQELLDPEAAKDVYIKRPAGRGWPEECPPIRAANAFGFDVLANFDITFARTRNGWKITPDTVIESDFEWAANEESKGKPLSQQYAWFWEKSQKLPHLITDNVYHEIKNQVKISSFLYLQTDPNELLLMTEIPNFPRPWKTISAVVDTDWYPASYPWHVVIELDPEKSKVKIEKGEPLCRMLPVRRDTYFAQPMGAEAFNEFFDRGQAWLKKHGKFEHEAAPKGVADITKTYVKQQMKSRFVVIG